VPVNGNLASMRRELDLASSSCVKRLLG